MKYEFLFWKHHVTESLIELKSHTSVQHVSLQTDTTKRGKMAETLNKPIKYMTVKNLKVIFVTNVRPLL